MQRKLTLSQLELLLAIAGCGSIGKAARQLHLTQSAASQSLASLEKVLGLPLFTRTAAGVSPTAFAQSILPDARNAIDAAQRIVKSAETAEQHQRRHPHRFSIAAIPSIAETLLPQWSKQLQRLFPGLEISLYQGTHLEVRDWVKQGITDSGITALAQHLADDLIHQPLQQQELLAVIRRDAPLMRQNKLTLSDAAQQTIIMAAGSEHIMLPLFQEANLAEPQTIITQDVPTALNMVRQGLGITILARETFPQADYRDLRLRSLEPALFRTLQLIAQKNNPHPAIYEALATIIMAKSNQS
ncbi:LysR family transcriptional regulator [Pseudochrobactrum asaccharolyticum]|uniref:LysR family transcriptional regulator n=1 Tax=Pseudochrobactrum asaccharolyticum TaxID=354351 RepID=A0A366DZM3_9HYPH|nr:LysR family transcriptional regulator [Pseudochrobactrum asaccharolyticum]RBO95566.1 LysR family transcriptional regulator [Pseudochrobactrum asaccharolyticum]